MRNRKPALSSQERAADIFDYIPQLKALGVWAWSQPISRPRSSSPQKTVVVAENRKRLMQSTQWFDPFLIRTAVRQLEQYGREPSDKLKRIEPPVLLDHGSCTS